MAPSNLDVGAAGEEAALQHLLSSGCTLLARDWRCSIGQADLVVQDHGACVLVEVKSRRGSGFGLPQEAVDWRKQRKLAQLMEAFRLSTGRTHLPCRIDVVAVTLDRELAVVGIDHIRDAVHG